MEERLDAWLKTYATESTISPEDWREVPDECRTRLDQFARDQAVHRADEFAHDGKLDLANQEAVRQFVDAMARIWKLQGTAVRAIVEEYYDELSPKPGHEFEKLTVRLFRRTVSAPASDVFNLFEPADEHTVITHAAKYLDVPPNQRLDRHGFLHALQLGYDTWTTRQPQEAVNELLETTGLGPEAISLSTVLEFLELRGARIWRKALMLEQDIGIEQATPEELVRILKRYALLVRRGGPEAIGLGDPTPVPEAVEEEPDPDGATDMPDPATSLASAAADPTEATPEEQSGLDDTSELKAESSPIEEDAPAQPSAEAGAAPSAERNPERERGDVTFQFRPREEASEEGDAALPVEESPSGEEMDDAVAQDPPTPIAPVFEDERFDQGQLDSLTDRDRAGLRRLFGKVTENEDEPVAATATSTIERMEQEGAHETKDSGATSATPTEPGWDQSIRPRFDRFAALREGDLREAVVESIYGGDETQFDIFLVKLSAAEDWDTGKRFIAQEMHRQEVNLEQEPARELFFALKKSLTD